MIVEALVITSIFRLAGAVVVLRWAFAGALIAIGVDLTDKIIINLIDIGAMRHYQDWDKIIDQVYLGCFFIVLWRWGGLERAVGTALYAYRLAGVALFYVVDDRVVLVLFANVFEHWFIALAGIRHWRPEFRVRPRHVAFILPIVAATKVGHEWFLHYYRWLDRYNAIEFLELLWDTFTAPFRHVAGELSMVVSLVA